MNKKQMSEDDKIRSRFIKDKRQPCDICIIKMCCTKICKDLFFTWLEEDLGIGKESENKPQF